MLRRHLSAIALACVPVAAVVIFVIGIGWGLPSRAVDRFLFGNHLVWSGEKIADLAPSDAAEQGADVDVNPIRNRAGITILNQTDAQRAEIIRRYRLYSDQPDEMITFRSLSMLRQHHGDPRLYQYGGMWIYPVGGLIRAAMGVGIIPKPPPQTAGGPQAYYIDHPGAFGRFYIIARLYSGAWGLIAVLAMYWILRRLSGRRLLAAMGAVAFALMPVIVTMSHEAKPHLPGLALTFLAAISAAKFIETGRWKWAILAGALCGAAMGMVISALLAFAILPAMALLRRAPIQRRIGVLVLATIAGVIVYCISNPFVPINAIAHPEILRSNLGNSQAMYHPSTAGFANALRLLIEGTSPFVFAAGVVGAIFLILRRLADTRRVRSGAACPCPGRGEIGWILAAPMVLVLIQFFLLAADKPPEYARFALLPDAFLVICAFAALGWVSSAPARVILAALVLLAALPFGVRYLAAYVRDSTMNSSRYATARRLAELADEGARTIRVPAEPAPYCMPPVDLFRYKLMLAPQAMRIPADIIVTMDHQRSLDPIGWADVRFELRPAPAAQR